MGTGFRIICVISLSVAFFCAGVLQAQTPPPESTSKVKRVLLYNRNGGWNCGDCSDKAQEVFFHMAQSKGFSVDTTSSVANLNLENLNRYQVIVWNNNHGGAQSVPDSQARNAVSEYVRQGGGWMLVNLANEHQSSWPFLDRLVGRGTSGWRGTSVSATLVADSAAKNHPELRYFVMALPDTISLRTNWLSAIRFPEDSIRFKSLYRFKNASWITITPNPDFYNDNYVWTGTHEQGKAIAIPLGWEGSFGIKGIMTQADSAVPRLYWQGLRWLAGDFKNGCINPDEPNYDPEARVDDGSCQALGIRPAHSQARTLVKIAGRRLRFGSPVAGGSRLRLFDLRGHTVWKSAAPKTAIEFDLPDGLLPGLYFLETDGTNMSFQTRILVP